MHRYAHGGDIHQAATELHRPLEALLDFSASINPRGMPAEVRAAARDSIDAAIHYPEIGAGSLLAALAEHHRLDPCHFLAGNGSTPLFALFARTFRPQRALLVRPAFSEYERALAQVGTRIDPFDLSPADGFHLDPVQLLRRVAPQTDLVLLANPGNPSGALVAPQAILAIARAVREQAIVAVDEAFIDFCPGDSLLLAVATQPNLYVFRSLTKFYAIPGLRAGFVAGPLRGIERLALEAEPWALSTPAIAAAKAALAATAYREATLEELPPLRAELAAGLHELGLHVFASAANFLLARLPEPCAGELCAHLRQEGILIRCCANFPPLDDRYLRLAVRTAEENARLLAALARILPPAEDRP